MYSLAQAEIAEAEVNGVGGNVAPSMCLPVRLDVSHGALAVREGVEIVSLSGRLFTIRGLLSTASPVEIGVIIQKHFPELKDQIFNLEFPLDAARIAELERIRAGGGMKLRLDAELIANKLHGLNGPGRDQPAAEIVWGYVHRHRLTLQAELTIPKDVWISRVLPGVGYGLVHVVEFPAFPMESCQTFEHSFKALKQAEERHKLGFYDDAVGKCRTALEPFFDPEAVDPTHPQSRTTPVLKKGWETKLGKATYDWLNGTFGAIKDASNRPHHSPNAHYSQFDSQMILAITTAVVAYAARATDSEEKK